VASAPTWDLRQGAVRTLRRYDVPPMGRLAFWHSPLLQRLAWYGRHVRRQVNRHFVLTIAEVYLVVVATAAIVVTIVEKPFTVDSFAHSFYWAFSSAIGSGDASYVVEPIGWLVRVCLVIFWIFTGAFVTGAIVAVIIDFLLKEGQGLGASGYRDHIVICGWNPTAREIIDELRSDDYRMKVVLICGEDRNPAGDGVYFIHGDPSDETDLRRGNIQDAAAALVFPADPSAEADMKAILTVMAIESIAPDVRTVAEVNDPRNVEHFLRAHADEVLVTPRLASRLLARSALYPGLTGLVTDMVSGGAGSELYRVTLPEDYAGLTVDAASTRLRRDHRATLVAVSRGSTMEANPPADFVLQAGDDALVVAESLKGLAPLTFQDRPLGDAEVTTEGDIEWVSGPPMVETRPEPAGPTTYGPGALVPPASRGT
jgi:voltage-gated potassium channel